MSTRLLSQSLFGFCKSKPFGYCRLEPFSYCRLKPFGYCKSEPFGYCRLKPFGYCKSKPFGYRRLKPFGYCKRLSASVGKPFCVVNKFFGKEQKNAFSPHGEQNAASWMIFLCQGCHTHIWNKHYISPQVNYLAKQANPWANYLS